MTFGFRNKLWAQLLMISFHLWGETFNMKSTISYVLRIQDQD